jgi:transposase-like protein
MARLAAEAAGAPTPRAALRLLRELRLQVDAFERRQVAQALADGASFAAIARDMGLSRQAVHRRFRDVATEDLPLLMTPDAGRVLQCAREEAAALRADDLRSEHVLIAALRVDVRATTVLRDAGVSLDRARMQVGGMSPHGRLFLRGPDVAAEPRALLAAAADAARARHSHSIEAEHLLLAALADPGGGARRTLRALGADPDEVGAALAGRVA